LGNEVKVDNKKLSLNETKNIMKTLKCDLCEATAEGETFEAWMEALKTNARANG